MTEPTSNPSTFPKSLTWPAAIHACEERGQAYAIATIINTQGYTPRASGSKMVIDANCTYDTIGGGQLEFIVVQQARELIARNQQCQILKPMPLAAEAGQCCGGNITVMLEIFPARDWQIALFGAGHVCKALTQILAGLPCQVRIIDNRPELMTDPLPANCRYEFCEQPAEYIRQLPDHHWSIIFTHDHALDFELCCALLRDAHKTELRLRADFMGMIGSTTKALRFRHRLAQAGFDAQQIAAIHSPIGLLEVKGKRPMEVAVSIAAQLQSLYYQRDIPVAASTQWRDIKTILREAAHQQTQTSVSEPT